MIDLKNVLQGIDEIFVLPIAIITFILIMYVVIYLYKKDPDVVRAKIFLRYAEFKKAFMLIAAFALVLIMHVALIYIPHYFNSTFGLPLYNIQRSLGLILVLVLLTFVFYIYKSIK